jgi:hypothetical protein
MRTVVLCYLCVALLSPDAGHAQAPLPRGTIKGKVVEAGSGLEIVGANVSIVNSVTGTSTNTVGQFEFRGLTVGSYVIAASHIGYERVVRTDVIVSSDRTTFVTLAMDPLSITLSDETVTAGYFAELETKPLSTISFSSEEIRRAPGAAGDVSRIIFGLPSLAKVNDTKNSLIVRGGSPVENGFYIDDIEIPNINHFPVQGSTEGPIGILNVDLMDDVTFTTGGFPAHYGNALSSIMAIRLREGNRETTNAQLDMSMQGFGGVLEGPLAGDHGSFLLSIRRSYLDLLLNLMNENVGLPIYGDAQAKVVYDLSDASTLSVLDVFSVDRQTMDQHNAIDSEINIYPEYGYLTNTAGLNWRWLWGKNGFSNTSIAHTIARTDVDYYQTRDAKRLLRNRSTEQKYTLRNMNQLTLSSTSTLACGFEVMLTSMDYDMSFSDYQDLLGHPTGPMTVQTTVDALQGGVSVEYVWRPSSNIAVTPSIRLDHYGYNRDTRVSPRMALTYHFNDRTSLTGSWGIYYQNIPWVIAAQQESFRHLKTPCAAHAVLSLSHLLTESTRLSVELYNKEYSDFPVDPSQPGLFLFDQAVTENIFLNHTELNSTGKARTRGIEVTIQKKLADEIFGLVSGAYYRSTYQGADGAWYNRIYDNRFNVAIEGGYRPDEAWEFSVRWLYAGGTPYTPFDEAASRASQKGVIDGSQINGSRLPDFHSLNIRADKRFHFQSSTLVTYLSIWNVYGRRNIAARIWNEVDNVIADETMWGTLPVFGITYEF